MILTAVEYDLNDGATCKDGFIPLVSSCQDCKKAAQSLGEKEGNDVCYDHSGWNNFRPEGCFKSDGNGRFHFNRRSGGKFKGNDKILCIKGRHFVSYFTS